MKTTKLLALMLCAALFFNSCTKGDKGDVGATGTTGPTGPTGAAGNTNVTETSITVNSWEWTVSSDTYYLQYLNSTIVTNYGSVMVYMFNLQNAQYIALPYTENDTEFYFMTGSGGLQLDIRSASGTKSVTAPAFLTFKIVVVPPGMKKKNVNENNFSEVKAAYRL